MIKKPKKHSGGKTSNNNLKSGLTQNLGYDPSTDSYYAGQWPEVTVSPDIYTEIALNKLKEMVPDKELRDFIMLTRGVNNPYSSLNSDNRYIDNLYMLYNTFGRPKFGKYPDSFRPGGAYGDYGDAVHNNYMKDGWYEYASNSPFGNKRVMDGPAVAVEYRKPLSLGYPFALEFLNKFSNELRIPTHWQNVKNSLKFWDKENQRKGEPNSRLVANDIIAPELDRYLYGGEYGTNTYYPFDNLFNRIYDTYQKSR